MLGLSLRVEESNVPLTAEWTHGNVKPSRPSQVAGLNLPSEGRKIAATVDHPREYPCRVPQIPNLSKVSASVSQDS